MKPFVPFTKPVNDTEFFSIEENTIYPDKKPQKYIHIHGYIYQNDVGWSLVKCIWLMIPLKEFIKEYAERKGDYVNDLYEQARQCQNDPHDEKHILDIINNFYGRDSKPMTAEFSEITEDAPYGHYVH